MGALAPARSGLAERFPAALLQAHGGADAGGAERDLDLCGFARVKEQVPAVAQPTGRLPVEDVPPLMFGAVGRLLEDPSAGPRLERDGLRFTADRVRARPPGRAPRRPGLEGLRRRDVDLERDDKGLNAHRSS